MIVALARGLLWNGAMSLAQLIDFPRHLLAATIERGRERIPVKVTGITSSHLCISPSPLADGERARLTIACPLTAQSVDLTVTAEAPDLLRAS
jgi:hypothetical protein